VVFARTGEAPGSRGLSAFVVPADTRGLRVLARIETMAPHPLAIIDFDCRVPVADRIGGPGEGFKIAMATLDVFRSTVGAAAVGFARAAFDGALSYVTWRKMFDGTLADLQLTQAAIADMVAEVDGAALMVYRAAWTKDKGAERITREAALAKMVATEAAQRVVDRALQLHGAFGVTKGQPSERIYREIRALRIYEGATEIQKLIIARATLAAYAAETTT
jgi:acyl-CoA dehydrogenase